MSTVSFEIDPPGEGWRALRSPHRTWSEEQRSMIRTAIQEHPDLAGPVKVCLVGWLARKAVKWREALQELPTSPPQDPVGRFACACILLHFAPLALRGDETAASAIDRFLQAVPYQLPGTCWLRAEQELYLERHLGQRGAPLRQDSSQDPLQNLSLRLLDHALDTYQPKQRCNPDRWMGEVLKNIKIDGQRRSQTEARLFEPMDSEEIPEELMGHHCSAEDEVLSAQVHAIISQIGEHAENPASRQMTDRLMQALGCLSDHQLAVLYLSLFAPPDGDEGIAEQLRTSVSNIRKRRHDARKVLRIALKQDA